MLIAGIALLDVTNTTWIFHRRDIAMNQTAWIFYRNAPWPLEIALNPSFGMDFGGSILFSDSIPLMAITFKLLSPILPESFQYFGLWVFLSFVLQGCFGWILMSRAVENSVARILGAAVISLTPLYIFRLVSPLAAHMSLTAHWIVLAALCLCLPPNVRRPWLFWGLLLATTAFIHIYLFAMIAALWCADLIRRAMLDLRCTWVEPLGIIALLAALISFTGVWSGPIGEYEGGFGWYKMNVLAFLDPNVWSTLALPSWSIVLPDIPNRRGEYEGFAYLGLGGVLLAFVTVWTVPSLLRTYSLRPVAQYAPLILAAIGMGVFAISNNVSIAMHYFLVPWPRPLEGLGELFRSTGRFIWPLYYLFFYTAIFMISRRVSQPTLIALLAAAAIIQAADIAPGWRAANSFLNDRDRSYQSKLVSPFWAEAARRYKAVRIAPHKNAHPRYLDIAIMAHAQGLQTDAVYLARSSTPATAASSERVAKGIATGAWPLDTLFVVDEEIARRASATLDHTRNALVRVDGVIALAPGWAGCSHCGAEPLLK